MLGLAVLRIRQLALLSAGALMATTLAAAPIPGQAQEAVAATPGRSAPAAPDDGLGRSTTFGPAVGTHVTAPGDGLVRLLAGAFDPLVDPPPATPPQIPAVGEAALEAGVPAYWLVQIGGRAGPARAAITGAEGQIAATLSGGTYVVRATPEQRATIDDADAIRWSGLYQPGWKVSPAVADRPGLLELEGVQQYRAFIFRTEEAPEAVADAIASVPEASVTESGPRVVAFTATAAQIPAVAALIGVEWIDVSPTPVLLNANSRWVNDTGVRDTYQVTAPGRLSGAGQTAGVADTGINYVPDRNGRAQVYFRDCANDCKVADYTQSGPGTSADVMQNTVANGTGHRKMAAYFDLGGSGAEPSDVSAHGTHVAGSVTGQIEDAPLWAEEAGLAPAARLVHQNIATAGGGLSTPADDYDLWRQAYRPRDPASVPDRPSGPRDPSSYTDDSYVPTEDARTHNNSYGLIVPNVSLGSAESADEFVWDHEDMVIVSSAGNGGPSMGTMGAPSVGKNVVSSGASANGRQPMSSIDSMASFSSHGPTPDNRFGVDLATPGQIVVSPKGGTEREVHYLQGTSMSGPVLTGQATLVREYFWEGYGPGKTEAGASASGMGVGAPSTDRRHNPSAALVRATMINGAERMRGFYTGDEGTQRSLDGQYPSAGQGFGLVQLHRSLYMARDGAGPASDRAAWYHDVYRGDDAAFAVSDTGEVAEHMVEVTDGSVPLSVTLAFTDAPSALVQGTVASINDLDLVVVSPSGEHHVGNDFTTRENAAAEEWETPGRTPADAPARADERNPVERVRVAAPETGTWTIRVRATALLDGPQGYALAANGGLGSAARGVTPGTLGSGAVTVSDLAVEPISGDAARVTFSTDVPTVGYVELLEPGQAAVRYDDHYNLPHEGYRGLDEATVETSDEYAGKPMITTDHEVLLTGLSPGTDYGLNAFGISTSGPASASTSFTSSDAVYAPNASDIGQLVESGTDALPFVAPAGWRVGTQLYAGQSAGDGLLGAFMFRLPESVDPSSIVAASVELTSGHDLTNHYQDDTQLTVDLLDPSVEDDWGTQTYQEIHEAPALARAWAETGLRRGGQTSYPFTFDCAGLAELRGTLADATDGERRAPFRFDAVPDASTSLFSAEFGFNRRSQGADLRPRLVLSFDDGKGGVADPRPCDPATPAPVISDVGIQDGLTEDSVIVTWRTDVPSDSVVLFREQGATAYTQVRSPYRSALHMVQVQGLDRAARYEFAVRSAACNGATTTDDNDGQGWHFFHPDPPPPQDAVPYAFEGGAAPGQDEAEKTVQFGGDTSATFTAGEPGGAQQAQQMTGLANMSFAQNPLAAYWTGDYVGQLHDPLTFDWQWSTTGPPRTASVAVTVFADPPSSGVHPDRIVASGTVTVDVGPTPQSSRGTIPLVASTVDVAERLVIQVGGGALEDNDLLVHYGPGTGSRFEVPVAPPEPSPLDDLPSTGPVPPPSASGFDAAAQPTRTVPTDADRAAGTGSCGVAPAEPGPGPAPGPGPGPDPDPGPGPDPDPDRDRDQDPVTRVVRYQGATRIQTAVDISRNRYPAGSVDTVVIARADEYPDALAGAPLAFQVGSPIILTFPGSLHHDAAAEVRRLGAGKAILLGGRAALSEQVAEALRTEGLTVDRVDGRNRFDTAALVARRLSPRADSAVIAEGGHPDRGRGWPDPLSAAPFAAHTNRPILLVSHEVLPGETADVMAELTMAEAVVVGGSAAVSERVVGELRERGHAPRRVFGRTRYETSRAVFDEGTRAGLDPDELWLATGRAFPDALAAGPTVAAAGASLMLVDGVDLDGSPPTRDLLQARADTLRLVVLLGGRAAISEAVEARILDIVR